MGFQSKVAAQTAPRPSQDPEAPVLLGRVVAGGAPPGVPVVAGVPYRTDPLTAQVDSLQVLKGIPVAKAERKVEEIRKGAGLAQAQPAFPAARRCRDVFWIAPFVLVCIGVIAAAVLSASQVQIVGHEVGGNRPVIGTVLASGMLGGAASLVAAGVYVLLARTAPGCVVWASLLFGPTLMIVGGLALLLASPPLGLILLSLGILSLMCVFCCYARFVPFTIKVTEIVSSVMQEHPGMISVSLFGAFLGLVWSLVCALAFVGTYVTHCGSVDSASECEPSYPVIFLAVLVVFWGAQVIYNLCHVTYCGVYGRWYHKPAEGATIGQSFRVAATTSFGSICLGALLVATIRALEVVLRMARVSAQEDGNIVCCLLLLPLECVVSCIGDILDYFSEWAYVQCAVRGASFVEAARITQSMMTCANLFYVLQALLMDSVVNLGTLFCGAVGCAVGAVTSGMMGGPGPSPGTVAAGAAAGFWAGLIVGGAAAGILSSGAKTILALWAEDPEPLQRMRPSLHNELEDRIRSAMAE